MAVQIRIYLHQGNLADAAQLAETHDLPLSQARVQLAQGESSAALAVLESFRGHIEAKGWADEQLKALVLQAVAYFVGGEVDTAVAHLNNALTLAEPANFIRLFVDEGQPMADLLTDMKNKDGRLDAYIQKLLAVFAEQERMSLSDAHSQALVEPLSERELEVLQLIAQGLSNREISERLFLAIDTVKGHNRKLFGKLGVQRRTEAVAHARELGLL
jgi:LuxR family maltose regulon positive regulatory protein